MFKYDPVATFLKGWSKATGEVVHPSLLGDAKAGRWISLRCPTHDDHSPSLRLRFDRKTGRLILHCFAGCRLGPLAARVGMNVHDLFSEARASKSSASSRGELGELPTRPSTAELAKQLRRLDKDPWLLDRYLRACQENENGD